MVTAVVSPPDGDNRPQGFCSHCHRVWTLKTAQGVCPWCGKLALSQTKRTQALRSFKSSSRRKRKQADGTGNGYHSLTGEWLTYYKVALPFARSVPTQDSEDLLHTIISNLADAGRSNGHKPDNQSWLYRIASFTKAQYWREHYRHTNGLDCGHCSKTQKRKCKQDWLYGDCPKLVRIESLNKPITDSEGNLTELGELIADDRTLDLDAWLDARTFLLTSPDRLINIAEKIRQGESLTPTDSQYLWRYRKREQKSLISM